MCRRLYNTPLTAQILAHEATNQHKEEDIRTILEKKEQKAG
jgi:hypothetical protein